VHVDHIGRFIVNANHGIMGAAAVLCVSDCVAGRIWLAVPKATKWQRIGNQIDTAMIFARADFVKVL